MFVYEINIYSDHNNMIYVDKIHEYQIVMWCRHILKEFGPNIQNISGFDNIVYDIIIRLPYETKNQEYPFYM